MKSIKKDGARWVGCKDGLPFCAFSTRADAREWLARPWRAVNIARFGV